MMRMRHVVQVLTEKISLRFVSNVYYLYIFAFVYTWYKLCDTIPLAFEYKHRDIIPGDINQACLLIKLDTLLKC